MKALFKSLRFFFLAAILLTIPLLSHAQFPPPANGLVAWWSGEGNGHDSSGNGHDGMLMNGVGFAQGEFGQAFSFSGNPNTVFVPDSPDFNLTNSLTIAAWIYIKATSWHVLERSTSGSGAVAYSVGLDNTGRFIYYIKSSATSPQVALEVPIAYNQWKHVTATLDGGTGDMRLYFDGVMVTNLTTAARPWYIDPSQSPALGIGNTPYGGGFPFIGLVDELVLYSRALSPAEVASLATGSNGVPVIVTQPQGQVGYIGGAVTFRVKATGLAPLSYLWHKDTVPIPWATNSSLVLTNLQASDAGDYSVVVTNTSGSVISSNASLVINPIGVSLGMFPGVIIEGAVGKNYAIQYTTNISPNASWTTLTDFTLAQTPQTWVDITNNVAGASLQRRYYRAVLLP